MDAWIYLIVIYGAVFLSGPFIAVLHELGHAIAYLILTKPENIEIYVGSYGDKEKTIKFKTGKLSFFIKRSFPFVKGVGLCKSSKSETNYIKAIVVLSAGTLFTFFSAAVICSIILKSGTNDLMRIFCCILLGFSIISLITNLIPRDIKLNAKRNLSNDGKQILFALKLRRQMPVYMNALLLIANSNYDEAIVELKKLRSTLKPNKEILKLLADSTMYTKHYDETLIYLFELEKLSGELTITELLSKGYLLSIKKRSDEAIIVYQQLLKKDKENVYALNNIAYELIEKGAHEVAKRALEKAIKVKPDFAHLYGTMAYSQILQGNYEEGKCLAEKCLKSDPEDAYGYKALAIYYLKLKDNDLAALNFNKALELDDTIDFEKFSSELKQPNNTQVTSPVSTLVASNISA